jgi:hypothetical protein
VSPQWGSTGSIIHQNCTPRPQEVPFFGFLGGTRADIGPNLPAALFSFFLCICAWMPNLREPVQAFPTSKLHLLIPGSPSFRLSGRDRCRHFPTCAWYLTFLGTGAALFFLFSYLRMDAQLREPVQTFPTSKLQLMIPGSPYLRLSGRDRCRHSPFPNINSHVRTHRHEKIVRCRGCLPSRVQQSFTTLHKAYLLTVMEAPTESSTGACP